MSKERDNNIILDVKPNEKTPEIKAIEETAAQRRARIIQVLDRGSTHSRFNVELPKGVHGEWARNDPMEIDRMKTLGFVVDTQYAKLRSTHSNANKDEAIVGDVIFMTCPKDVKDEIDAIRLERYQRLHGKPGENFNREEKEFQERTRSSTGGEIGTVVESKTSGATVSDIAKAVGAVDAQTNPI